VTLYGIVDNGIGYQSSATTLGSTAGGHSIVKMTTGVFAADRLGVKGAEDLGGGTQAIFALEQGFNAANGAESVSGLGFSRLAYVGLTNPVYGTLSAGRVYSAYYTLLQPYSPEPRLTGYYAAHPGDIDGTDTDYHENNTVVYTSPNYRGLTISGEYSFGGVAGSLNAGSAWSAGAQYINGPFGIAAAFWRINNSTPGGGAWGASSATGNNGAQIGVSAINVGYQTAQAQQRFAVAGGYAINSAWDFSLMYSNVQYIPGTQSSTPQAPCCTSSRPPQSISRPVTPIRARRMRTAFRRLRNITSSRSQRSTACRRRRRFTPSKAFSARAARRSASTAAAISSMPWRRTVMERMHSLRRRVVRLSVVSA
jgi:predicted porin